MKFSTTLIHFFISLTSFTTAYSWDDDSIYIRDALAEAEAYDDAEGMLWARDADAEAEPEAKHEFEEFILARDADADADFDFEDFIFAREAKKQAKQADQWVQPKINVAPGEKITKDTFKCNKKSHQCSGQIVVAQ